MCLAFFLIVPSVIVVTIFLVHSIAQRIGFKVKYFSLTLCAIMSLGVELSCRFVMVMNFSCKCILFCSIGEMFFVIFMFFSIFL